MLKRKIAILIAGGLLSAQAGLAVAENAGAFQPLPAQSKYFAEREAADPKPTGSKVQIFAPTQSALWGTQSSGAVPGAGGDPSRAKYFAEQEIRARAEGAPRVSVFDDCQMHSHGAAGFHS